MHKILAISVLLLLAGCYRHQFRAYGNLSSITFVAPSQDEANVFCLRHEIELTAKLHLQEAPSCHYNRRIEVRHELPAKIEARP